MYGIPNEDEYWERVRECLEAPRIHQAPEMERGTLFLDEELDVLEEHYGCSMEDLGECDLLEVVEEYTGVYPEGAEWDGSFGCITYKYFEEAS